MTARIAEPIRVDVLRNPWNLRESAVDVRLFRTDLRDFVVIADIGEGSSVTNAAESICPQVAERLMLVWSRCVFVESYPPHRDLKQFDPTFDRILFVGDPVGVHIQGQVEPLPVARISRWMPLDLSLALSLQAAGLAMSRHLGQIGRFASYDDDKEIQVLIRHYDGRRYYGADGRVIRGHFLGPDQYAGQEHVDA